jgi:hypothetical protein
VFVAIDIVPLSELKDELIEEIIHSDAVRHGENFFYKFLTAAILTAATKNDVTGNRPDLV